MPGLNQLKKFASNIKDLGDEVKIRAQRGEKPAVVPFPEGISEEDDSEDFVLGVPDSPPSEETADAEIDSTEGEISQENSDLDNNQTAALDLDALLNPSPVTQGNDVPDLSEFLDDEQSKAEEPEETPLEDLDLEALLKPTEQDSEQTPDLANVENENSSDLDDLLSADLETLDDILSVEDVPAPNQIPSVDDIPVEDLPSEDSVPSAEDFSTPDDLENLSALENLDDSLEDDSIPSAEENSSKQNPSIDDISVDDIPVVQDASVEDFIPSEEENPAKQDSPVENFSLDDIPEIDSSLAKEGEDAEKTPSESSDNATDDFSFDGAEINLNDDLPEEISELDTPPEQTAPIEESVSDNSSEMPSMEQLFSTDDLDSPLDLESPNSELTPPDASLDVPAEEYDLSAMDGLDFSDEAKTSQGDISDEFPVTEPKPQSLGDDDFILDENDFEIPGFSDTETANFDKKNRPAVDVADFSNAVAARPKNTLTDEEYIQFKKNLAAYPLNLRLAVEDLIVKNEFTDDAVFEVVEKVLKKAPARQVATHLEKMLEISIDVPRDYERRSFAQYEAYKQSFQYQLKNRIIPGGIVALVLCIVGWLLFQASVMFIYKPTMARMLYKQGYVLLENNEYPQSEIKFSEAVRYKPIRKWFFKYAHAYRDHKQYERSGQMYRNILNYFKHDLEAGLEWAQMELYERANYERAEEIVRREVLDYHINSSDGLLLLGDIFLEWADIDSSKYDEAREQYSNLIQLYGATDTYMSRMMRYFIRTDRLRNVLELKNRFYPNKKSLCAEDWVELSGYLLDKIYGPLPRSEEYLRSQIEDLRSMLEIAEKADPSIPASHYNMARYFVHNGNFAGAKNELQMALDCYDKLTYRTKKNIYGEIDTCRILGELYADTREYLKAQEIYTRGIVLYQNENEKTGLKGDLSTGLIYSDMGDIEYFISGDMEAALKNYEQSLKNQNDTASINFRVGAIRYGKKEYDKALASFIRCAETESSDTNLLISLGNVLALRGDNFAAQGYYSHLLALLDTEKARHLMLFPQEKEDDNKLVEMYLKVNNNLGVTLYRIARQTGDSQKNAEALVRLSDSIRAWDALTRNPETMVRMEGSNLALQNSKYITNSRSTFEPAIYTDIPKTLVAEKILE